jgi:bifunctional non-homologous end joining protein LigD
MIPGRDGLRQARPGVFDGRSKQYMARAVTEKLKEYGRKRNFGKTPEPSRTRKRKAGNIFVVHEHHARRHHWDLRLEVDGVLASWAVPKHPSMDPKVKRLAVHVEDHPLDYAEFEGTIPAGEYGAGEVAIWDSGTYTVAGDPGPQIEDGKFEFVLDGKRLKGRFVLVQMKGEGGKNWLLMKKSESARVATGPKQPMPKSVKLQLCKSAKTPPTGRAWVHEVKWDGYRALAYVREGEVTLVSRNGNALEIPHLERALDGLSDCIMDGEIVAVDKDGKTSFPLVHAAIASKRTSGLIYYCFDVLYAEGRDVRRLPLLDRKTVCKVLVDRVGVEHVRYSDHSDSPGPQLFKQACSSGLEGIISKRADGKYGAGRTGAWVKCRCVSRIEGWVCGFTPHSAAADAVGALVIGVRDAKGSLVYAGRVGTGMSESQRRKLYSDLGPLATRKRPFESVPSDANVKKVTWVEPRMKAEVEFLEWSPSGSMRQPSLVGTSMAVTTEKRRLEITHPDRIVDPVSGTTKQDVADYYEKVADRLLPYVAGRPLSIIRCPDGISGACFFQKHWMQGLHPSVKTVDVGEDKEYMWIDSAEGLKALVQFGMVEIHVWGSKVDAIETPDTLVFDLDPSPDVTWKEVLRATNVVRAALEDVGLACWARVTGGKGFHIVVPIKPEVEWGPIKEFCKGVATTIEASDPARYVSTASKAKRQGRIFIDYLRNGRGSTAIASYGLRARPGMSCAVPVSWEELSRSKGAGAFTVKSIDARLKRDDPWRGFTRSRRSLRRLVSSVS